MLNIISEKENHVIECIQKGYVDARSLGITPLEETSTKDILSSVFSHNLPLTEAVKKAFYNYFFQNEFDSSKISFRNHPYEARLKAGQNMVPVDKCIHTGLGRFDEHSKDLEKISKKSSLSLNKVAIDYASVNYTLWDMAGTHELQPNIRTDIRVSSFFERFDIDTSFLDEKRMSSKKAKDYYLKLAAETNPEQMRFLGNKTSLEEILKIILTGTENKSQTL